MEMTAERWERIREYLAAVFGQEDPEFSDLTQRAAEAGLPNMSVGPEVGRLLMILTSLPGGGQGAETAVEIGTLWGYSALWIARGLARSGRLISVESVPRHAEFAEAAIQAAGLASKVEVRRQRGLEAGWGCGRRCRRRRCSRCPRRDKRSRSHGRDRAAG